MKVMLTKSFVITIEKHGFEFETAYNIFNDIVLLLKDYKINLKKRRAAFNNKKLVIVLSGKNLNWELLLDLMDKSLSTYSPEYEKEFSIRVNIQSRSH